MRWSRAAGGLLAGTWCFHLWRAATAAVTTDEAFTATEFVAKPWLEVMTSYDANHHVLHTVLCKAAVGVLGWSELALRLPALGGTALFLWSLWRLGRRWAGETPALAAACLFVAWWPEVSEALSVARGYSLGLGFLTAALAEAGERRWRGFSVLGGLAVAANLTFALPVAAVGVGLLVAERLWGEWERLAAPGLVTAAVVVGLPLTRAGAAHFYYGARDWRGSVESLFHVPGVEGLVVVVVGLGMAAAMGWAAWKERGWLGWGFGLCVAAVVAGGVGLGVPLPAGRTGVGVLVLGLWVLARAVGARRVGSAGLAAAAAWCAAGASPDTLREWRFDADQREVLALIEEVKPGARVACTPPLRTAMEYYRRVRGAAMPAPVDLRPGVEAEVYVVMAGERGPDGTREVRGFERSGVRVLVRRSGIE